MQIKGDIFKNMNKLEQVDERVDMNAEFTLPGGGMWT